MPEPRPARRAIKKATFLHGLRWSAVTKGSQALFSILTPIILARLLVPEDFGLISMAAVFTGIATLFIDFGTGAAIIRQRDPDPGFLSSVFWFNILLGMSLCLAIVAAAPWIASLYGYPILKAIIYIQSVSILLASMTTVPSALLRREVQFRPIAVSRVLSQVLGAAVGIVMAAMGFGVWSLVFFTVTNSLFFTVFLWFGSSWRPGFTFSVGHIREIFHFSSYVTATQLVNYFQRRGDKFIVGYYLGDGMLGLYSKAYNFLLKTTRMINGFFGPVIYPVMAAVRDDRARLRALFLRASQAFAVVYFPIAVFVILFAEPLVLVVLGEQWAEMTPLVPVFAGILFFQPLSKIHAQIYTALGKVGVMFALYAVFAPIMVMGFLVGARFGIYGVALSYAINSFFLFIVSSYVVFRLIGVRVSDYWSALSNIVLRILILAPLLFLVRTFLDAQHIGTNPLVLMIMLAVTPVLYLSMERFLPVEAVGYIREFLLSGWGGVEENELQTDP